MSVRVGHYSPYMCPYLNLPVLSPFSPPQKHAQTADLQVAEKAMKDLRSQLDAKVGTWYIKRPPPRPAPGWMAGFGWIVVGGCVCSNWDPPTRSDAA